jgi:hypothetical protein
MPEPAPFVDPMAVPSQMPAEPAVIETPVVEQPTV